MTELTATQRHVFNFVRERLDSGQSAPTIREISIRFGWKAPKAAADHVTAIIRKGWLVSSARQARSLRLPNAAKLPRRSLVEIPLLGSIPAGFAEDRRQEAKRSVAVDRETIGIKASARTFALEVRGDSMIGKHIVEGDVVVLEHGATPHDGDVVAALIDNESTLKTYCVESGKPVLRAENPKYPKLIPASELVIQGVMVALIRKRK
jgi:repressor LexA